MIGQGWVRMDYLITETYLSADEKERRANLARLLSGKADAPT